MRDRITSLKRALAISLLFVFLFQLVGYYFVYLGFSVHMNKELMSRLDAHDYAVDQTLTLKIPFTLPYWMNAESFERVDGDFEYQGQFYKLVKQKLSNDTLYVVCIKNTGEKKLFDALSEYIKLSNDLPASSKQALKLWGSIVKDYLPQESIGLAHSSGWSVVNEFWGDHVITFASPIVSVISPPPKRA